MRVKSRLRLLFPALAALAALAVAQERGEEGIVETRDSVSVAPEAASEEGVAKPDRSGASAIEESAEEDSVAAEEEGFEVYEYDRTQQGYRPEAERDAAAPESTAPLDLRSIDTYPVRPRDSVPEAYDKPTMPIGKTVTGIILTADGGAFAAVGMILMIVIGSTGGNPPSALPFIGAGLGQLIPGAALIASARQEWAVYNGWEEAHGPQPRAPAVRLRYTLKL
jgi:hypothetical protein